MDDVTNVPIDGLALWDSEACATPATSLSVVRVDGNERLLVPFTTVMLRKQLHYVSCPAVSGYLQCNGDGCLLCRVGRQQDVRDLWPVYDVLEKQIGVLPISPNLRPQALRPQLAPILRRLKGGKEIFLISVRKLETAKFVVTTLALPEDAEDGAASIQAFQDQFAAGTVDLAGVYPRLSNEELAAIPEVATALKLKGLKL